MGFEANPTGKDYERMKDDGMRFRTRTATRGPGFDSFIPPGTIVSRRDLPPGTDIDAMMRSGSLEQVTEGGLVLPHAEIAVTLDKIPAPIVPASIMPVDPIKQS